MLLVKDPFTDQNPVLDLFLSESRKIKSSLCVASLAASVLAFGDPCSASHPSFDTTWHAQGETAKSIKSVPQASERGLAAANGIRLASVLKQDALVVRTALRKWGGVALDKRGSSSRREARSNPSEGVRLASLVALAPMTIDQLAGAVQEAQSNRTPLLANTAFDQPLGELPFYDANEIPVRIASPRSLELLAVKKVETEAVPVTSQSPILLATVAQDPTPPAVIRLRTRQGELEYLPAKLSFAVGSRISVEETAFGDNKPNIFLRSATHLSWDSASRTLQAKAAGKTEIYVVHAGKMYILPVTLEKPAGEPVLVAAKSVEGSIDFSVPASLTSLNGLSLAALKSSEEALATHGSRRAAAQSQDEIPDLEISADHVEVDLATTGLAVSGYERASSRVADLSQALRRSREMTQRTLDAATESGSDVEQDNNDEREPGVSVTVGTAWRKASYVTIDLQVIDERSRPAKELLYPAIGAQIAIVGTSFVGQTDATGHLSVDDMPESGRFLATIDDPERLIYPTAHEFQAPEANGVVRLRALRSVVFDAYQNITGVVQDVALGSICAVVLDREGLPVADIAATLDVDADGPYGFNKFGLLNPSSDRTGTNGRLCWLNVDEGPITLTLVEDSTIVAAVPLAMFAGRHREIDLVIGDGNALDTKIVMQPTAHEQLDNDEQVAQNFRLVDFVELIPLGDETPLSQRGAGLLRSSYEVDWHGNRAFAFSQAAEFEPVVYAYERGANHVTPLLPRGFVEDMALYAQVSHDPSLGVVLVHHGSFEDQGDASINIKLVDVEGSSAGEGWYYADTPHTRAIFFNVPPGTYVVMAETSDGHWLDTSTLHVYSETVSFLQLGSSLR